MTNALPTQEIERILEACMPAFHAHCSRGADGTFSFQFQSRCQPDSFAIVGIRVEDCRRAQQVRRLGKLFLEDLALATEGRDPSRPLQDATQPPSQTAGQG
ncbi:MAG TPA: hypothetical protein VJA19_11125 [Pseudomonas sp.]|nr:hypothetical protein [Pseudomonas sp.]